MSKRKHDEFNNAHTTNTSDHPLFESTPIHDRSSTFTAIFSPSTAFIYSLQPHPPFDSASHKILAWRKPSAQKSITSSFANNSTSAKSTLSSQGSETQQQKLVFETGSDDDGEKYAGKKVEKVLSEMGVVGTVVVARWYGGVLLGPVRFKWIEDSAREAILKWKASLGKGLNGDSGEVKKVKVDEVAGEDDGRQTERLIQVLGERDASVNVLRVLLAEKNTELRKREAGGNDEEIRSVDKQEQSTQSASTAVPDYATMPLQRLRQIEKARDATLSWILKQIDLVEEKIEATRNTKDGS